MRALVVIYVPEFVEALLLELHCQIGRACGFGFERSVHPLVRSVLFGMAGNDPFDGDAEANPPKREPGKPCQTRRSERTAIVRQDCAREAVFTEDPLECALRMRPFVRRKRIAREQVTAHVIDHGQRIAVAMIAEEEMALVVDRHEVVRLGGLTPYAQWMCGRCAALARLNEIGPAENIASGARGGPFDIRMDLGQPGDDL